MAKKINADTIMEQVDKLNDGDPGGFSTVDMRDLTGKSLDWCRKTMRDLIRGGKAIHVGHRTRKTMDGKGYSQPIYRLVKG